MNVQTSVALHPTFLEIFNFNFTFTLLVHLFWKKRKIIHYCIFILVQFSFTLTFYKRQCFGCGYLCSAVRLDIFANKLHQGFYWYGPETPPFLTISVRLFCPTVRLLCSHMHKCTNLGWKHWSWTDQTTLPSMHVGMDRNDTLLPLFMAFMLTGKEQSYRVI